MPVISTPIRGDSCPPVEPAGNGDAGNRVENDFQADDFPLLVHRPTNPPGMRVQGVFAPKRFAWKKSLILCGFPLFFWARTVKMRPVAAVGRQVPPESLYRPRRMRVAEDRVRPVSPLIGVCDILIPVHGLSPVMRVRPVSPLIGVCDSLRVGDVRSEISRSDRSPR